MSCAACGRGFHKECLTKCKVCHPKEDEKTLMPVAAPKAPVVKVVKSKDYKKRGKTAKDLKDAKSTGRKRAAQLYPINENDECEWQGRKNCGGGMYPIVGCIDGKQKHCHHGPVKDTTRNQAGNVHRVCNACHNHWHELNDLVYEPRAFGLLPHDPEPASPEELVKAKFAWTTGEMGRKFTLASSVNKKKKVEEDEVLVVQEEL